MKNKAAFLTGLLLLTSCSVAFSTFGQIDDKQRDVKVADFVSKRNDTEKKMPDKYTLTFKEVTGNEEGRNPLFGEIIYRQDTKVTKTVTLAYQKDSQYYHYRTIDENKNGKAITDDYFFVAGKQIVSYTGTNSEISAIPSVDPYIIVYDYATRYQATQDFYDLVKDKVEDAFNTLTARFDKLFDNIVSTIDSEKLTEGLQVYHAYERQGFPKDIKIEFNEYFQDDTNVGADYGNGVYVDYLPSYLRRVTRKKAGGGYKISETEAQESSFVLLERPRFSNPNEKISSSYSRELSYNDSDHSHASSN